MMSTLLESEEESSFGNCKCRLSLQVSTLFRELQYPGFSVMQRKNPQWNKVAHSNHHHHHPLGPSLFKGIYSLY
jgi:hypothetical protein